MCMKNCYHLFRFLTHQTFENSVGEMALWRINGRVLFLLENPASVLKILRHYDAMLKVSVVFEELCNKATVYGFTHPTLFSFSKRIQILYKREVLYKLAY